MKVPIQSTIHFKDGTGILIRSIGLFIIGLILLAIGSEILIIPVIIANTGAFIYFLGYLGFLFSIGNCTFEEIEKYDEDKRLFRMSKKNVRPGLDWEGNTRAKVKYKNNDGKNEYYQGSFLMLKRDGKGVYTFSNKDMYDGSWRNDKMHGKGVYKTKKGKEIDGVWENGKKID